MHRTLALILICVLSTASPVLASEGPSVEFGLPAQAGPDLEGQKLEWALLVFETGSASGQVELGTSAALSTTIEHSVVSEVKEFRDWTEVPLYSEHNDPRSVSGLAELQATGVASIFIHASHLNLTTGGTEFRMVDAGSPQFPVDTMVPPEFTSSRSGRYDFLRPVGRTAWHGATPASGISLEANGISLIETHGFALGCEGCPDGNDRQIESTSAKGLEFQSRSLSFHQITLQDGQVQLSGTPSFVAFGGSAPDFLIHGDVRLPNVQGISCTTCFGDAGQTLSISGSVVFQDLVVGNDGRASGFLSGEFSGARLDETAVPVAVLGLGRVAVATAATIGLVALVKFLAVPLFTRLSKTEALEHPKRQRIYAYIQENPGANFREVARQTGIATGTVRHHLTILERAGHIVEHAHQGTVRLFENHGKFDHNWSDLVLLREPPLAQVHAWLVEHPHSPQKAVLEAFELLGWSRSTTQHRLARLVEGGVASIRLQGRLKIYAATTRQSPRPLTGPNPAPSVPNATGQTRMDWTLSSKARA